MKKKNFSVGERYNLTIDGLSHSGEGVGRVSGMAVFVPEAIPGDQVEVELISVKKNYARGLVVKIQQPSNDRIEPVCPFAKECGGCQLQHMTYQSQLYWKEQQVKQALARLGKLETEIRPIKGMDTPFGYRNKAQFPLGYEQQVVMGFYRKRSHDIVNIDQCGIQHPMLVQLSLAVKELVHTLGIQPYREKENKGHIRHLVARISFAKEELMAVLVTTKEDFPGKEELVKALPDRVPGLVSIAQNINSRQTNVIFGDKTTILWGKPHLIDEIGDLQFAISPRSFFQVNPTQTQLLYELVKDAASLNGKEVVWDIYCGIGTIGLYLATGARKVHGIEVVPEAIEDAIKNAELNNITNAQYHLGRAEDVIPRFANDGEAVDVVVLDPPRKGSDNKVLATIIDVSPKKVIYVSCNPQTLARDLAILTTGGYEVKWIQPVDMFPHTSHVETVCLLTRK